MTVLLLFILLSKGDGNVKTLVLWILEFKNPQGQLFDI